MIVEERIKMLIEAENYVSARIKTSDEFIDFLRTLRPKEYELIKEKEKEYQGMLSILKEIMG